MVFNLSDVDIDSMQYAVGRHNKHIEEVTARYLEKKQSGQCTCPIKIQSKKMGKYLKNLERQKKGILYKRTHDNGYNMNRPKCPVHDLGFKTIDPNEYQSD